MPRPVPHVLIIGWTDFDLAKTTENIDKTVFAFTFTRTWKLDIFDNYDAQNTIRAKLEKLMYLNHIPFEIPDTERSSRYHRIRKYIITACF